jgi:hypothetical protein
MTATWAIQDSGIFVHPFSGDLIAARALGTMPSGGGSTRASGLRAGVVWAWTGAASSRWGPAASLGAADRRAHLAPDGCVVVGVLGPERRHTPRPRYTRWQLPAANAGLRRGRCRHHLADVASAS